MLTNHPPGPKLESMLLLFSMLLSNHSFKGSGKISTEQYKTATTEFLKTIQKAHFAKELSLVKSGQAIDKSSSLWHLDCYKDHNGILRVGGRM